MRMTVNIVNLCCYGEGYYSGATYEENIAVSKDFFEKIKSIFTFMVSKKNNKVGII